MQFEANLIEILERIAVSLEKQNQSNAAPPVPDQADAFMWQPLLNSFTPVHKVNRIPLDLLYAIAPMRDQLLENTRAFAKGFPANNALLWGARGMGKSSLVKAVHGKVQEETGSDLKLIEINREDIQTLPQCLSGIKSSDNRYIIFCDDLSFDNDDTAYKSLKSVLEGGLEGRPDNVIFYATSNRRHMMPREMVENERSTAINPAEAVEEKVSLSDRFGLWIGFHNCSQSDYLNMVRSYAIHFKLEMNDSFEPEALEWCITRGSRSGRVAWQFIQYLAGKQGRKLIS
ncbi:MAG: ATP-binding protein [Methyloligellaceae bacterium]